MGDPDEAETVHRALGAKSRGEVKRWGAFLDGEGRRLRAAVVAEARRRGADLAEGEAGESGRALLKRCLDRGAGSQVRRNPIQRDEAFTCAHCAALVPAGGRRPRDHCPRCLHSLHVDVVPGDRAERCGGLLVPVGVERRRGRWLLRYRCGTCSASRVNRVLDDIDPPDDPDLVRRLVVQGTPGD